MKTRIIKDLIKRDLFDYRIEGDYHVYTVKIRH